MLAELSEEHCRVCFRILFLSRYVSDIAKVVDTAMIPTIEMKTSDNDYDIQQFIKDNIRASSLGRLNEDDRRLLILTLKERANGSFLWIKLVMEELEGRRSMRLIEEALKQIPANRSLEGIYQLTLDSLASSCDQEDIDVAREIFMWILCAPRPLSLEELTAALEASMQTRMMDVERAVKETCGSLIEVIDVHSQKQVMAVHITLHEFMQSGKATGCFAFSKADAHSRIARTCLNYLEQPQFSKPFTVGMDMKMDPVVVAAKYPLLNYASRYWSYHLITNLENFDPNMNDLILHFLQSRNVITCIEAVATFGSLNPLSRFSDNLRTWLDFSASKTETKGLISIHPVNSSSEAQAESMIARWALDFRRLKQRFQHSLVRYPRSIHDSLPSFCPTNSMIFRVGALHADISIMNPSSQSSEWGNFISMFPIPGFVRTIVCSPKRLFIASAVDSSTVIIWDAETGQAIRPLKGHRDLVYALAYSKDDVYLASGGKDEIIIVWNVERGHEMFQMRGHAGAVHALTYSYSGEYIASGGQDSTVRIWQISDDYEDGWVAVWNASRGTLLRKFNVNLKWMGRLSFHPSWHYILSSSEREPHNVEIWNIETCNVINTIVTPSPVRCWKYSPSGQFIVTGHLDGEIRIWESVSTELLHTIHEDAWGLWFSGSGKYLISLTRYISRWQVRIWDFDQEMSMVFQRRKYGRAQQWKQLGDQRLVQALTVNMDNSRLATVTVPHAGTWNGRVKLWNPVTMEILWEQEQTFHNQECVAPCFSPDGRFLACYDSKERGRLFLVDAVAAKVIEQIHVASVNLVSLAVDVDACSLAIASREVNVLEDENAPGFYFARRLERGCRHLDIVTTWGIQNSMILSYTADGTKLLLAARDRQDNLYITVWNTDTQQIVSRVVHDQERYVRCKMVGGFRLLSQDRIVVHVDYMSRDGIRRSHWQEKMLVLTPEGEEVQRFETGSSQMTISNNRIIFLDKEYWVCSWDGQGTAKRLVKLPEDVGYTVSGMWLHERKLTLMSRTEEITVVELVERKRRALTFNVGHLSRWLENGELGDSFGDSIALMMLNPTVKDGSSYTLPGNPFENNSNELDISRRVRLDCVRRLVDDYWGPLGLNVLLAFTKVLKLATHQQPIVDEVLVPYTDSSNSKLYLCATTETGGHIVVTGNTSAAQWRAVVTCVKWLIGIIGAPQGDCNLKTRNFLPASPNVDYGDSLMRVDRDVAGEKSDIDFLKAASFGDAYDVQEVDLSISSPQPCWIDLVGHGYIAAYSEHRYTDSMNPLIEEWVGIGLKVPFDLLLHVSGVDHLFEVDGTPVLCGFQTALVPVDRYPDGSVQWHFITVQKDDGPFRWFQHRSDFRQSLPNNRVRHISINDLQGPAYVGWCSSAVNVILGTKNPPTVIPKSLLQQTRYKYIAVGFDLQAAVQISPFTPLASLFGIAKKYDKAGLQLRFTPCENTCAMIDQLYSKRVIIYDEGRKTAFLCLLVNLILSLVRGYLINNHYSYDVDTLELPLPIENSQSELRKLLGKDVEPGLEFRYGDVFKVITYRYSAANASLPTAVRCTKSEILGFEVADILGNNDDFCARKLAIDSGIKTWSIFAELTDVVFCREFGDVVTTADTSQKLRCAQNPPTGCNILVCPFPQLKKYFDLIEHNRYKQKGSEGLEWILTGTPFDCHKTLSGMECNGRECWEYRLQCVRRVGWVEKRRRRIPPVIEQSIPLEGDGAVCFGRLPMFSTGNNHFREAEVEYSAGSSLPLIIDNEATAHSCD